MVSKIFGIIWFFLINLIIILGFYKSFPFIDNLPTFPFALFVLSFTILLLPVLLCLFFYFKAYLSGIKNPLEFFEFSHKYRGMRLPRLPDTILKKESNWYFILIPIIFSCVGLIILIMQK
jgi:hypothetical protein